MGIMAEHHHGDHPKDPNREQSPAYPHHEHAATGMTHDHSAHQGHGAHGGHDHSHMVADFKKRFWLCLVLTLPVLALSPMIQHMIGAGDMWRFAGDTYVVTALSTVVFFYGGWSFLNGLRQEIRAGNPGMMTLIDKPQAPPHVIRIDIDPAEMRRLVPHVPIVADAAEGARALCKAVVRLRGSRPASPEARQRIAMIKREARAAIEKVRPQLAYLDVIREVLPRDGILTTELCQVGFTSYFGYPVNAPRTYISEGYQGTLGFGFPTALGVKAAHPGKPVVCVTGDGGFLFAAQELTTAKQEGLGLVTVLFNNGAYGNVLRDQRTGFGNRVIGSVLQNPDFLAFAASFGVEAHRVASPEALRPVLAKALQAGVPVLIEVTVPQGSEASPWEFIHCKP